MNPLRCVFSGLYMFGGYREESRIRFEKFCLSEKIQFDRGIWTCLEKLSSQVPAGYYFEAADVSPVYLYV
jgi:hypothetical protein